MSIETLLLIILVIIIIVAGINWYMQYSTTHAKKFRGRAKELGAKEYSVFKAVYGLPMPMNTEIELYVCDNQFVLDKPSEYEKPYKKDIKFKNIINVVFANMNTNFRAIRGLTRETADMIKHVLVTESALLIIMYRENQNDKIIILDGSECDRFVRKLAREYGNKDESIENVVD